MNRHPSEPLTQEERELAQLIARVEPQGEPAAALDAKILAAAHAAAHGKPQRARKPRWPVAMGLAASVVFAVGIAWQLRPLQPAATVSSEAPATAAAQMAMPAETEPTMASAPPMPVDAVAQDSAAAAADVPMSAPPPPPAAKPLPPRSVPMPPLRRTARIPPPQAPPATRQAQGGDRSHSLTPPSPAAPVMATPAPAPEAPSAFASEPRTAAVAVAEGISANQSASQSASQSAGYSAARTAAAKQSAARGEMKTSATGREQAMREQERGTQESSATDHASLDHASQDRVEVTGSRLQRTDRQVPVADDARLPVDEWLERVRTRYGLGDAEAAKRSLLLFVHEHPSEAVPSDLEPLLEK